jgi:hypothetical protein
VVKPVDFSEFMVAVKQVGVFWAAVNESLPIQSPDGISAEKVKGLE